MSTPSKLCRRCEGTGMLCTGAFCRECDYWREPRKSLDLLSWSDPPLGQLTAWLSDGTYLVHARLTADASDRELPVSWEAEILSCTDLETDQPVALVLCPVSTTAIERVVGNSNELRDHVTGKRAA